MYSFYKKGGYRIKNRGEVAIIENPFACFDFDWLLHTTVRINGKECFIIGIERMLHYPPYRKGELIGLLIQPDEQPLDN